MCAFCTDARKLHTKGVATKPPRQISISKGLGENRAPQLLRVKPHDDALHQFANRVAPIVLTRPTHEIPRQVMHPRLNLALAAAAMHRDHQHELAQPASDSQRPAEAGHQLFTM